VEIYLSTAKH